MKNHTKIPVTTNVAAGIFFMQEVGRSIATQKYARDIYIFIDWYGNI